MPVRRSCDPEAPFEVIWTRRERAAMWREGMRKRGRERKIA